MSAVMSQSQPKLAPILEVARQILAEARKPLHIDEIAEIAVRTNRNLQLDSEALSKRLGDALLANINTKSPRFAKVKNKTGGLRRGIYKLRAKAEPPVPAIAPPSVSTNFLGKAGEHAVMSELLFWGYNASLMSVDEGIDVVASKNNHYFHVQVKSAAESDSRRFNFKIKLSSFVSNLAANTFYIFVLRRRTGTEFLILPSSHLDNLRNLGIISGTSELAVSISSDERGRVHLLNGTDDVSRYMNNFSVIR
jgi:hypothetical protein